MSKKIIQDIISKAVGSVCGDTDCEGDEGGTGRRAKRGTGSKFLISISLIVLGVIAVLAIFLLFSSSFSRVALKIETSRKIIEMDDMIVLNKDGANGGIKYDVMKFDDKESVNVPTTGSSVVQRNASGIVTIYNSGKTIQKLVIGTRLETEDGKIYKIDKSVSIPAAKQSPGSITVSVHAALPGQKYNIPPSEFKIPGLKGSAKYDLIRASSSKEITGGYVGEIRTASAASIEKARDQLREALVQKLTKNALLQVPKDFILYNEAIFLSFADNVVGNTALSDVSGGQPALKMTGTLSAVIFNQNDLRNYIIAKKLQPDDSTAGVVLFDLDKLNFKILNKDKVIPDGKQLILANILGQVPVAGDFNEEVLKAKLIGIKKTKYQDVFKEFPTIEKAEAMFSPSWALYFPSDASRITVNKGF